MEFSYKPDMKAVVERHRLLWACRMPDRILAMMDPEGAVLYSAETDPANKAPNIAEMFTACEEIYRRRKDLEDDSIPVGRVSFGSNAFGAYLGAEVVSGGTGGFSKPLLTDWSALDKLRFNEENEWIQRQKEACRYYLEHARGKFPVCEMETIDALNLADVLRGTTQAFMDVYDHPDELARLMDFGADFNIRFIEMQRQILRESLYYEEGIFDMFWIWLPGRAVWLSVDAYASCAPQVFEQMGRQYIQRLIDHFGSGWLHIHSNGVYLLPQLVKLRNLVGIGIFEDPGPPRPFEQLAEIRAITGDIPLQIHCHRDELEKGMRDRTLPGGIIYWVQGVRSIEDGNRLMEKVRAYRAPLA